MSTNEPADVVVVGAGLAGLAAAARAATNGCRVVVVDGRSPGGRARTDDRKGFAFNQGPHALYKAGPGASVLRRLGLTPTGGRPALDTAMAWRDGKLWPLPFTATGLLTTRVISTRAKTQVARFFASVAATRSDRLAELSAAAWLSSLDLRADALQLVSAVTRVATYASNLELLSADAAARQNQLALRGGVSYLDGGWQTLVDGLVRRATDNGASILTGRAATTHASHRVRVGRTVVLVDPLPSGSAGSAGQCRRPRHAVRRPQLGCGPPEPRGAGQASRHRRRRHRDSAVPAPHGCRPPPPATWPRAARPPTRARSGPARRVHRRRLGRPGRAAGRR